MSSTTNNIEPLSTDNNEEVVPNSQTFFASMPHKFSEIKFEEVDHVPIQSFLDACRSLVPVFDLLGPTLFSPVIKDIQGNINKLNAKHQSNPETFTTLQKMVLYEQEVEKDQPKEIDATDALLWLKRALEFIAIFFKELISGSPDLALSECASNAYSQTLKAYHGWIVRGVFSVIVRAVPNRSTFLKALSLNENGNDASNMKQIELEGKCEIDSLDKTLSVLKTFYAEHNLDSSRVV